MDSRKKDESERTSRRRFLAGLASVGSIMGSGCVGGGRQEGGAKPAELQNEPESTVKEVSQRIPELVWNYGTGGTVLSTPVLSNRVAYVGSYDGYLYALEGASETNTTVSGDEEYPMYKYDSAGTNAPDSSGPRGELSVRWRFPTDGRVSSTPAVLDGNVYFGSEDNFFYSVSSEDGEENWRYDAGRRMGMGASPTVVDNTVYFGSGHSGSGDIPDIGENGGIHALNAETGDEVWTVEVDGGVQSPPLVYDGLVYHGCQNNSLYARDPETGDEVWRFEGDGVFCGTSPAAKNGVVYSGNLDNSMYAIDADDGSLVWEFETGHIIVSSPVATEEAVYFGSYDKNLYAVDPETGDELWRFNAGGSIFSSPAYRDGVVYFGTESGWLFAVDGRTGEEVWSIEQSADRHHAVRSSPVVTEEMVYFGTEGNSVYGVRNRSVGEEEYEETETTVTIRN